MASSLWLSISGIAIVVYLSACWFFYARQDRLIFPGAMNDARILAGTKHRFLTLKNHDVTLTGFHRSFPDYHSDITVLYFGGNAEDISGMLYRSEQLRVSSFYSFNYRGYGTSRGQPSEEVLVRDAWGQFHFLTSNEGVKANKILLIGRSLGSGVAIQLARKIQENGHPLAGIVLVTPYDSLQAVARHHAPWLPVRWLLRHPFDSFGAAQELTIPALFLIADQDQIIPPSHSKRLAQAWQGEKETVCIEGYGHNDLDEFPDFYPTVRAFIERVLSLNNGAIFSKQQLSFRCD